MDEDRKKMMMLKICVGITGAFVLFLVVWITITGFIGEGMRPRLCIQDLYVPSLKNPTPSLFNATPLHPSILIDIRFKDTYFSVLQTVYADLQMTVFYGVERSFPVANHTLPGFPMDGRGTVHKGVAIDAPGLQWEDAIRRVSGGLAVDLVVGLAVKYADQECGVDQCDWPEGMVWTDVAVDASGEKVSKKPIAFAYRR